jgi:hypothetical protein
MEIGYRKCNIFLISVDIGTGLCLVLYWFLAQIESPKQTSEVTWPHAFSAVRTSDLSYKVT